MSINKFLKLLLITVLFFQFQTLKADDTNKIDEEELPAIDPFAGGVGNTSQGSTETTGTVSQGSGLLNNMRLVGTIMGKNKKIAIFSSPDGGAFKYVENDSITDSTMLIEVFNEVVIIRDETNNEYEVYMNNIIKPIDG
ncbi:hypothetical protein OA095_01025 [Candidatus Pelagibacter sp.]|nr:hypothetical protein [Candidatus Pelagibacter sp.]